MINWLFNTREGCFWVFSIFLITLGCTNYYLKNLLDNQMKSDNSSEDKVKSDEVKIYDDSSKTKYNFIEYDKF